VPSLGRWCQSDTTTRQVPRASVANAFPQFGRIQTAMAVHELDGDLPAAAAAYAEAARRATNVAERDHLVRQAASARAASAAT
jgi:hypothetical protein